MLETVENTRSEKVAVFITFATIISMIILGFVFIPQALREFNQIVFIFIIYAILNMTFPTISFLDIQLQIKWFYSLMFNPQRSLLYELYKQNKKNKALEFLWKINSNYILSFLFWMSLFSVVMFFGLSFAPQSSISSFIGRYVFPVRPQSIFELFSQKFFFTVFPAPSESGALGVLISITDSLVSFIITLFASRFTAVLISLFVTGVLMSGFYWLWIHRIVSAGRQFDQIGHFFFGMQSGILTIFTGSWTAMLSLHVINLTYWFLQDRLAGNELLRTVLMVITIIVFFTIMALLIIFNKRGKKKSAKKRKKRKR